MNMKKLQKIFVILCAFIMLLSVNYSVNAIDSNTLGTTVTTTTSTFGSTPVVANSTPTTTPSTTIDLNAKVSFFVRSTWTGNDKPPVLIRLFANGVEKINKVHNPDTYQEVNGYISSKSNAWQVDFNNLPKYDSDGKEIEYTVKQDFFESYLDGWNNFRFKTDLTGDVETGFIFENKSLIDIEVGKMWNEIPVFIIPGTPSPASLNPTERLVNASREYSDNELDTILAESDALDADGDVLAGAQDTSGDPALEDMSAEERREKNLKKSIVAVPNAITVNLLADGVVVGTMQITKEDGWTGYFRDYLRYDETDGHEIVYTVEEVPVPGYKTEYINKLINGRVINAIVNRSVIDINVKKKWEGKIQGPVNVTLCRKFKTVEFDWSFYKNITIEHDEEVATVELNEANNWQHTFEDLYEFYTVEGDDPVIYEYYVKEDPVAGYNTVITGNHKDGFTITNTNTTDLIDIPVEKKWDGDIADSAKVTLLANGEEVETVELNEANSWKHVFTGLQKYNNDGSEVAYTIKEVGETASVIELDGKKFDVEYTGNTTDGFTVTNKKPIDPPTPTPTPTPTTTPTPTSTPTTTPTPTPTPTTTPTPKTSDNSHVMSYALLTLLSAIFVVIVASKRIKYSN